MIFYQFNIFLLKIFVCLNNYLYLCNVKIKQRCGAEVAREAHNLKVGGSIPPTATKKNKLISWGVL